MGAACLMDDPPPRPGPVTALVVLIVQGEVRCIWEIPHRKSDGTAGVSKPTSSPHPDAGFLNCWPQVHSGLRPNPWGLWVPAGL